MPDQTVQAERVLAGDVQVGDRVARARTHPFVEVTALSHGPKAVRLAGPNIRPLKTAKLWREVGPKGGES